MREQHSSCGEEAEERDCRAHGGGSANGVDEVKEKAARGALLTACQTQIDAASHSE